MFRGSGYLDYFIRWWDGTDGADSGGRRIVKKITSFNQSFDIGVERRFENLHFAPNSIDTNQK